MPENCHPSIASSLFDKPGQQREMVVLHQNDRVKRTFHLFDDSVSELVVDSLVVFPIIGPEDRPGVSDPGSIAGAEHRFECRYQSAGRNANLQEFATAGVHIGLTIGDHEKSPVSQAGANMNGEPVSRPLGLSLLA